MYSVVYVSGLACLRRPGHLKRALMCVSQREGPGGSSADWPRPHAMPAYRVLFFVVRHNLAGVDLVFPRLRTRTLALAVSADKSTRPQNGDGFSERGIEAALAPRARNIKLLSHQLHSWLWIERHPHQLQALSIHCKQSSLLHRATVSSLLRHLRRYVHSHAH